jgi:hypothetical protein
MSSRMVGLKFLNHAKLGGMNAYIGKEAALNHQAQKNPFYLFNMTSTWIQREFTLFSTRFQQILDILRFFSQMALLSIQTESKGNFESMSLYRHIARFQPQAIRAKKQTFSNSACCHFAPPKRGTG